ncbi:tyrosine-protein kinase domain-containing protein [Tessaracoccus sp. Y1736]
MAMIFGGGVLTGLLVSLLQPVLYSATSTGYVVAGNSATVGDAFAGSSLAAEKAETYLPLVRSRSVAERVTAELELATSEPVVGNLEGTTEGVIFTITATADSPDLAASMADAAIRATSIEANALETLTVSGESSGDTVVRIVPVEQAEKPVNPVSPNYKVNLALGALLGLMAGLGTLIVREGLDHRIRHASDAEEIAESSALGIVPSSSDFSGKTGLVSGTGAAAEAIRQIRTNLRFVSVDNPPKSIVITSSTEGEGKSTLAANIAGMLADAGEPTILIDADLRRPVQAERMGLDGAVGLSQVLAGTAKLTDAILPTRHHNLTVLPAGRIPPNPAEMVGSSRMKSLIAHLSKAHTVIIDAPPLLPVTDAALLTSSADGAVVVVQSGKTKAEQLGVAARKIRQVDGSLLGVVLNKVGKKDLGEATFGYGYGSYTSKYYRAEPDVHTKGRSDRPKRVTDPGSEQWAAEPAAAGPRRPVS